ncbi:MAG: poly-beta-1,6-N-acetyl-D-glucosamine N-deacetylase PgaB, partial [Cupriavidus sp.]|nr:poly-beta-1,6-N-acetyl-D-glucosamine N-deacetylase PgaB [Cupriavidus sp.]
MNATLRRACRLLWLVLAACLLAACAKDIPVFTPPAQRPAAAAEQPWPRNHVVVLAYHDVEDKDPDQAYLSVRTDHLVGQLAWLRENGYRAVSVDQVLAARRGGPALPERAVLLTFDDGYRSFYTRVLPILKAYRWPAVLAPVGGWLDTPPGQPVDFGGTPTARERLLDWQQVREIAASGLVEIGAHTDALHYGVRANPQGNTEPAAAVRAFDAGTGRYESDAAQQARLRADVARITAKVRAVTGKPVRVWIWPYGAEGGAALRIVAENGYQMALTLEDGLATVDRMMSGARLLLSDDPGLRGFARSVVAMEEPNGMRVAHVDLDYVYDPDPAQVERNLGLLVQRIADLKIDTVFLQAFSDDDGDGLVRSVYFPNRWLPVRADLFNRVAWQLDNRANVKVYAWMPVLSFDLDPSLARVARWDPATGAAAVDPKQYRRLSPFDPVARARIGDLYEDLARHAFLDGILFHDDALLGDFEDASAPALAAYRAAGLPASIAELRASPEQMQRWTRLKSRALVDLTHELTARVREVRGPAIKTARNIFALPVLQPQSEAWFAQNLDDFLAAYDWTAPMAMPYMEQVPAGQENAWLDRMVDTIARR